MAVSKDDVRQLAAALVRVSSDLASLAVSIAETSEYGPRDRAAIHDTHRRLAMRSVSKAVSALKPYDPEMWDMPEGEHALYIARTALRRKEARKPNANIV